LIGRAFAATGKTFSKGLSTLRFTGETNRFRPTAPEARYSHERTTMETNKLTSKPFPEVAEAIQALDLESVKSRLMDAELGEGWTPEYADSIEAAYKTYLTMVAKYQDDAEDLLLAKDVDEFWHTHILQTLKYADDCNKVFGTFLHHTPHIGERTAADHERRAVLAEKTRRLYEQEFGERVDRAWSGRAIRAESAAYSGAAIEAKSAAYSGAAIEAKSAAYSGAAIHAARAAYSGAAIAPQHAAYSGVAIEAAAYSGATIEAKNAAYSGAAINAKNAAYSGAAIAAKNAAYSGAAIGARDAAYSGATINAARAAYSGAAVKA
jgi:hypothetical protein